MLRFLSGDLIQFSELGTKTAACNLLDPVDRFCGEGFFHRLGGAWFHALPASQPCVDGASLACVARFLAGPRPVLVYGLGVEDP